MHQIIYTPVKAGKVCPFSLTKDGKHAETDVRRPTAVSLIFLMPAMPKVCLVEAAEFEELNPISCAPVLYK